MIGQCLESRPGFPLGAVFWLTAAAALVALAGVQQTPHWALLAVPPAAVGVALLYARERPFQAQLTADGLEIQEPPLALPYPAIKGLLARGGPRRAHAPIQLIH